MILRHPHWQCKENAVILTPHTEILSRRGGWPIAIVQQLSKVLPENFTADPRVHLGKHEYEVLVYDQSRGRQLVAAVEIVSPADKDRPESRAVFVAKRDVLLQKGICVSLIDLVATRHFNLYTDLLELIGKSDPAFRPEP